MAHKPVKEDDKGLMPVDVTHHSNEDAEAQEEAREARTDASDAPRDDADEMVDDEAEEEAERPRGLRDPGMPSAAEVAEHNLTHIPSRPWCAHCMKGKGKNKHSRRLCGAYSDNLVPRVRLDYCFFTEKNIEGDDEPEQAEEEAPAEQPEAEESEEPEEPDDSNVTARLTVLVMQENLCRSVWAYAVDRKGAAESWVVDQIAEDINTIGLKNERIILKNDPEPSANDVARALATSRESDYGTALENSEVGESNSNGTVERAIQDVEGQVRTLRSALEHRIGTKVKLASTIVPWLVRHAAYLITGVESGHPAGPPSSS